MNDRKKPKISKVNDRSLYGKTPLESWVGTVVSYDAQKDQLESGWGWRYKVRVMGDNTQSDTTNDDKLDYLAYFLMVIQSKSYKNLQNIHLKMPNNQVYHH